MWNPHEMDTYGTATDYPFVDIDLDGDIDSSDFGICQANLGSAPAAMTYSSLDNPFMFTGRTTDTLHADDGLRNQRASGRHVT